MYEIATDATVVSRASGRVLIAATESNLDEVRAVVATLGERAHGQVFVEVPSAAEIDPIATPERVTVTWLRRDLRSGEMGTGLACAPGQALRRAVRAWVGEMSTGDAEIDGDAVCLWFGRDVPNDFAGV
ncbi:SIP domain-containing protein [Herbiconiux sp. KACC 21604]|uniref:SIP domain-containing protein n=1 Tax=unclassified Herbiconiux TaxID=2618217 RepID=UPI001490F32A|nr:SIP domain-containing protein [Herbiconiux sp. SALV-R1]QJU53792.1 SIP domain-containing protein [Herbiconiux sp. SALV-R1]WPO84800.1 SIP domain-containing protein [Herbiconiux sp. KACC 21604]